MIISANTLLAPGDGDVGAHAPPSPAAFFLRKQLCRFTVNFLLVQQLINVHIILGVIQSR
ncbi:Alkaline phosphatase-like alpha/beta/alpha [Penicillium cf. viridicatum]|uniref:Alkaline phosphatase-like alpha/beta/alpha n=1 Tax=Penicillium cf. viridicatum TaxID=2972119 RepID=A0A9W9MXB8_9EURO|nr:Alkaline phosphatase-like alpha/beta/alpha [Penicillium cf. viridicatum]